jgi:hypothetical protein
MAPSTAPPPPSAEPVEPSARDAGPWTSILGSVLRELSDLYDEER